MPARAPPPAARGSVFNRGEKSVQLVIGELHDLGKGVQRTAAQPMPPAQLQTGDDGILHRLRLVHVLVNQLGHPRVQVVTGDDEPPRLANGRQAIRVLVVGDRLADDAQRLGRVVRRDGNKTLRGQQLAQLGIPGIKTQAANLPVIHATFLAQCRFYWFDKIFLYFLESL